MNLQYDEALVEAAVFLFSRGGQARVAPEQIRRFHRERERLYSIRDPDERNTGFFQHHLEWFREWGLERSLRAVLDEFPLLTSGLKLLAFRRAVHRRDEGAELFIHGQDRNALIGLRAERFCDEAVLAGFLRHESMHLHDMIDPAFDYSPELPAGDQAQERLTRERYRLLWDITIDARLAGSRAGPAAAREAHWRAFQRAFGFWEPERLEEVFRELWDGAAPRHARLLEIACDPRGLRHACGAAPGAPCPSCGFPTFNWITAGAIDRAVIPLVSIEVPGWSPEQGMCDRCHEVYQVLAAPAGRA